MTKKISTAAVFDRIRNGHFTFNQFERWIEQRFENANSDLYAKGYNAGKAEGYSKGYRERANEYLEQLKAGA